MKTKFSLKKDLFILTLLGGLLLLGGFFAVSRGSWDIQEINVIKILLSKCGLFSGEVDAVEKTIVWDGRVPRLLVAFLVGFALASAGAVM